MNGPSPRPSTRTCPGRDDLFAFSVGALPEERREAVAAHLDACPKCLAVLQTLDDRGDGLIQGLRGPAPTALFDQGAGLPPQPGASPTGRAVPEAGRAVPQQSGDRQRLEPLGSDSRRRPEPRRAMDHSSSTGWLPSEGGERLLQITSQFQQAWAERGAADIDPLLPAPGDALRPAALRELIGIDLEARWSRGQRAFVEEYLRRYP